MEWVPLPLVHRLSTLCALLSSSSSYPLSPLSFPPPFLSFPSALLFSATFRKRVERLCRDTLTDPVRIVVGDVGEANTDITQIVEVMQDEQEKWQWLLKHLVEFTSGVCVCLSVCLSLCLFVCLSLCLFVCLSVLPCFHHILSPLTAGSVLVFVTRKVNTEAVATSLRGEGHQGGPSSLTLP